MKNLIKNIALSILIMTIALNANATSFGSFHAIKQFVGTMLHPTSLNHHALFMADAIRTQMHPKYQTLQSIVFRAKSLYGFESQYPIHINDRRTSVASSEIALGRYFESNRQIIFKRILIASNIISPEASDLFIFTLMHEHQHLLKDHFLQHHELDRLLKSDQSVVLNNVTISPDDYANDAKIISRIFEEEADAGVQHHPPLCKVAAQFFMNRVTETLQDPKIDPSYRLAASLEDPDKIKEYEFNKIHPHDKRRALYFKKWAKDGGLKTL